MTTTKTCPICGAPLANPRFTTCSLRCGQEAALRTKRASCQPKPCRECGREFVGLKVTCSDECARRRSNSQKKAAYLKGNAIPPHGLADGVELMSIDYLPARGLRLFAQEPRDIQLWWLNRMPPHVRVHAERMIGLGR